MLRQYHSELGEKQIYETTARFNYCINKWVVKTKEELKGQGIKFYDIGEDERNIYCCTRKAFEKLCNNMNIDQELLFD